MDFETGQIFDGIYPPEAAAWCNTNSAHIEKQYDGKYVIVKNSPAAVTDKERVQMLEGKYNLPRAVRTALLALRAQGAELDPVLMERVDEIEFLAALLRAAPQRPSGPAPESKI